MTERTKEATAELKKHLDKLVQEAYVALSKATDFADEHKLDFSFGVTYGMGGRYDGDVENRYVPEYIDPKDHDGWYPSSQGC